MTQPKKRLKNWTIAFLALIALGITTSCEEDNMLTGTELVGEESLISPPDATASVVAFSQQLRGIRTNSSELDRSGIVGVHVDPVFGKTTINLLTQLRLGRVNPSIGEGARVDSVKLYLPYYSRSEIAKDTTYILDSVYAKKPMNIEVYESNYFLREMDPNTDFESSQAYFSDQVTVFENYLGDKIGELTSFVPKPAPIILTTGEEGEEGEEGTKKSEKLNPGLYMDLDVDFFEEKILAKAGEAELVSNESFVDYFRGIYIKVNEIDDAGSMFMFKMEEAHVKMYYSLDPAEGEEERPKNSLELNLAGGTKVETVEKEASGFVTEQLAMQDSLNGSSRLLLQGGESIVSIVKLFGEDSNGSGVPDELEQLRIDKPIVNEANLVFHVDQSALGEGSVEPERIIIFNAENGRLLTDYAIDQTASANTMESKIIHLGRLERDNNKKGISYKVRITNFVSDLINDDKPVIPLGIAIIPNVEIANPIEVKEEGNAPVKGIPFGTIFSPRGTVLHGPVSENEDKRLKLELYLTEVN